MKIKPISNRVLVKPEAFKDYETTDGGILMPGQVHKQQKGCQQGLVVAVGTEVQSKEIAKGVNILFQRYAGTEYKPDPKTDLLLLTEDDILAVIE